MATMLRTSTSSSTSTSASRVLGIRSFATKSDRAAAPLALAQRLSGKHFIGGLRPAKSGAVFDVHNPATGETIGHAALGDEADINDAVTLASRAQKEWREQSVRARGALVAKCGEVLRAHVEELAQLTSLETGKAIRTESRVEAGLISDTFSFFGGLAPEIKGQTIPFNPSVLTYTSREPVGVVGAIIPWNAPLLLFALKLAPALVAGNAVVLKSAEAAPFGVLRVTELLNQVLPSGLVSTVSGYGKQAGTPLVRHPLVKKVTFTGSVDTGREIYKQAAEKLIPVTLELGGKSPMIVLEDANFEKAVNGAILSMRFTRQGQSCTAASRIYVHEAIHDKFVAALTEKINALKAPFPPLSFVETLLTERMGDPLDETTDIGTVISKPQLDKIQRYIALGKGEQGATAHECSALPTDASLSKGLYVRPVVFTGISNQSRVAREEIFGPVTCVFKFNDFDAVLDEANSTEYGLSASVWTNDLQKALHATRKLEAGVVQVNQNAVVQPNLPVGGWKVSGLGREGSLETMLEHFTHSKTVAINFA
ncbi:betaine aldehyde dehydrogenase [Acanthamoeba castellanii str. Neff]|uniref:Betaine aldehyde dehydrogenase n=1 Tax=Acanthamoeba castellanii (strain ATCC 30010 / Neff) TaxID=1257118 RepID=L8HHI3_ACACF|nr:betaine aldehyde dehydrogenase [Acanthamoeba castellanii str. Neff]ELR24153.1 betaine aldehyde dehydrogenase [Acanthamoeba castellanii str. Neff]